MEDHDCALIGYSGRDIDLYPSIRSASLGRLRSGWHAPDQFAPLLWLNRFQNGDVESNKAHECGAVMLYGFPSEVIPGCLEPLRAAIAPSHQDELRMFGVANARAHEPRNEEAAIRLVEARDATIRECVGKLPALNEDLLCAKILVQWQRNTSASRFLAEHGEALGEAASGCDQRELLTLRTRVSREIADLTGYARYARKLLRLERSLGDRAPRDELVWARLEVISAYYLRIPNFDTSRVGYAWWVRILMALGAVCVWARLWLLRLNVPGRGPLSGSPAGRSATVQEVENRLLALEFHMLGVLRLPRPVLKALRDRLETRLADLGWLAAECANTSTVKGVIRRISRLGLADNARFSAFYQGYRETFDTFPDKSQLGSLRRDEGTLEGASASLEAARETGNTLNELKEGPRGNREQGARLGTRRARSSPGLQALRPHRPSESRSPASLSRQDSLAANGSFPALPGAHYLNIPEIQKRIGEKDLLSLRFGHLIVFALTGINFNLLGALYDFAQKTKCLAGCIRQKVMGATQIKISPSVDGLLPVFTLRRTNLAVNCKLVASCMTAERGAP